MLEEVAVAGAGERRASATARAACASVALYPIEVGMPTWKSEQPMLAISVEKESTLRAPEPAGRKQIGPHLCRQPRRAPAPTASFQAAGPALSSREEQTGPCKPPADRLAAPSSGRGAARSAGGRAGDAALLDEARVLDVDRADVQRVDEPAGVHL